MILAIRPEWLEHKSVDDKKEKLTELAKNGLSRPSLSSKCKRERTLARALNNYTTEKGLRLHRQFVSELREHAPDWF